jgi:S-adenosyl methyltransferase
MARSLRGLTATGGRHWSAGTTPGSTSSRPAKKRLHARALLTSRTPGATSYLDADLRDTAEILHAASELLDFRQPIAVRLIGILQLIPDEDDPHAIVARLIETVPPGSWLAVFHPASDIIPDQMGEAARRVNAPIRPGLVQVHRWRPGSAAPEDGEQIPGYAGLARKLT